MTTTKIIKDSIESSNESTQEVPSQNSGLTEPPRNKGGRPKGSKNTLTLLQEGNLICGINQVMKILDLDLK